jgi:hypothetical protein
MKKTILSSLCGAVLILLCSFAFTQKSATNETPNTIEEGRQCCTVQVTNTLNGQPVIASSTACSGWALSNDAESFARACDKARRGLNGAHESTLN